MKKSSVLLLIPLIMLACNSGNSTKQEVTQKAFGNFDGQPVTEYTLSSPTGIRVSVMNYGATVTKIVTPDKNGVLGDIVLGYDSLAGYLQAANPYFGAIVGRYANRIGKAAFVLNGIHYQLDPNDHGNTLHGGFRGFDKAMWTGKATSDSTVEFTYESKDGEGGYPGNLNVKVVYTLSADSALRIDYTATTDKPTPVNLTNHSYFNLSAGMDSTVLGQVLWIDGETFTPVDSLLIPTGQIEGVKGTPMDFTTGKPVGRDIDQVKGGYDLNWVLDKDADSSSIMDRTVATLYDPGSGRFMEVFTSQPGLQFYSGNFLDGTLKYTRKGRKYVQHAALCLETQHFPDSPNEPSFPSTILNPGDTYHQTTVYRFTVR